VKTVNAGLRASSGWGRCLVVAVLVATTSSCSASQRSSSAPALKKSAGAAAEVTAGVLAEPTPRPDPARQIAYTSDISVRVRHVDTAMADAIKLTQRAGGFVFSQSATYQDSPKASLSLRVPPSRFRPLLGQLIALGTLLNQDVTAEDVTEQVTDLNGRLKTASASASRLRGLLARAAGTADIVAIESELAQREQEIESVQGQINALASRVNYATINMKLAERGTAEVSKNIPGFRRGLHNGWVAFVNIGKALLTALGASLPFLPFGAIALWLVVRYRRRLRARPRPRPVQTTPWQAAPPPFVAHPPDQDQGGDRPTPA
jgi:hypothetical protein